MTAKKDGTTDTLRMTDVDQKKESQVEKRKELAPKKRFVNREEEPAVKVKINPEYLIFRYMAGSQAYDTFLVENTTAEKQAFKVKSNSNKCFVSRPTTGFIEPGAAVHIKVIFLNPPNIQDSTSEKTHVALFHVAAGKFKTPKEAFKAKAKTLTKSGKPLAGDGVHHFYCEHRQEKTTESGDQPEQQ